MSLGAYCELPEFYDETFPAAKKQHRCVECFVPILPGEIHLYYRGKWDGEFGTGRQHMTCRELCILIKKEYNGGECIAFGDLFDAWPDIDVPRRKRDGIDARARHLMARVKRRARPHWTRGFRRSDVFLPRRF